MAQLRGNRTCNSFCKHGSVDMFHHREEDILEVEEVDLTGIERGGEVTTVRRLIGQQAQKMAFATALLARDEADLASSLFYVRVEVVPVEEVSDAVQTHSHASEHLRVVCHLVCCYQHVVHNAPSSGISRLTTQRGRM